VLHAKNGDVQAQRRELGSLRWTASDSHVVPDGAMSRNSGRETEQPKGEWLTTLDDVRNWLIQEAA
jgi:hypothetical protein